MRLPAITPRILSFLFEDTCGGTRSRVEVRLVFEVEQYPCPALARPF
jgi:hypothetical protein